MLRFRKSFWTPDTRSRASTSQAASLVNVGGVLWSLDYPSLWGMKAIYRAVVQQREGRWIGWIEEVPGVNSQGETREELLENLRSGLEEALEMNRADAQFVA